MKPDRIWHGGWWIGVGLLSGWEGRLSWTGDDDADER